MDIKKSSSVGFVHNEIHLFHLDSIVFPAQITRRFRTHDFTRGAT